MDEEKKERKKRERKNQASDQTYEQMSYFQLICQELGNSPSLAR